MNATIFYIIRHFLYRYLVILQKQKPSKVDSFFRNYFMRDELIAILKWRYSNKLEDHLNVYKCSHQELLDYIGCDAVLLEYFLLMWGKNLYQREHPNGNEVWETLTQLGQRTHYLGNVATVNWNEYDRKNFLSLQYKAGRISRVYGIYDANVDLKEVHQVTSPSKRLYGSLAEAQTARMELSVINRHSEDELQVIELLKAM